MSDHTDSPVHGDTHPHTPAKLSVPKDRNCPYCHQAFTSSSLGRHLDLYIKPKNPKPPDGIHNVEEIRNMRSSITRRQARTSSLKKQQAESQRMEHMTTAQNGTVRQILENTESRRSIHSSSTGDSQPQKNFGFILNKPNWMATGVINDLPPRQDPLQAVRPAPPRESSRGTSLRAELEAQHKLTDQLDKGKAADLALKEVLRIVMEANTQGVFQNMFGGYNLFELDFPSLCLSILPPPSTLFSTQPFPTAESWTLGPPGQKQYDALQVRIRDRISLFRQQKPPAPSNRRSSVTSTTSTSPISDSEAERLLNHVLQAWQHWSSLDEEAQQRTWTLCILRSYTQAETFRKEAESTIDVLKRQIEHLSIQLAKVTKDYSLYRDKGLPSNAVLTSIRLNPDTLVQIHNQGTDMRNWDYDKLIEKWRDTVREERESGYKIGRAMSEAEVRRELDLDDCDMRGVFERSESLMSGRNGEVDSRVDDDDEAENSAGGDSGERSERSREYQQRILGWPASSSQENGLGNNVDDHAMQGT